MIIDPTTQDRILRGFRALARSATPELAALYRYDYVVASVDTVANTLSAMPYDRTAKLPPLSGIPIRTGIPGATVNPAPGTRFEVGFLDADFTKYVVMGGYDATQAVAAALNALAVNLGPAPKAGQQGVVLAQLLAIQLTNLSLALQAIQAALDNLVQATPGMPAIATASTTPLNAAVDAAVLAFNLSLTTPNYSATVEASP